MKKFVALVPLFLMCVISAYILFLTVSMANNPPADAVGHANEGGPPTIYMNTLVDHFVEGGEITSFQIVNLDGSWNLLRKGLQNGHKRTEVIPLSLSRGYFRFVGPIRYGVCNISTGTSAAACNYSRDKSNTVCACDGISTHYTLDSSEAPLLETQVLN
jgi:hypothetical protein